MSDVALELASVTKRFGAVLALDGASLIARRGTVHALLGENGAGKTTLMRIAFGMLRPDSGRIMLDGAARAFRTPRDAIAAGIGMVHQHFSLVPAMTVAENIVLGDRGRYDPVAARDAVQSVGERSGLRIDPGARVADLSVGAQQRVEILKALYRDARVLVLDEPTAVLTPEEARDLLQRVREFVARGGTAILITHKLREALEFADDITVLRSGTTVWTGPASEATEETLVRAMLGETRTLARAQPTLPHGIGAPMLSLRNVSVRDESGVERLHGVNFVVRAGEIVGIAAVEGNGQRELLRVLAGRLHPTSGNAARPDVVGFIPEDRRRDALVGSFTLTENVALLNAGRRHGIERWDTHRDAARHIIAEYDVRAHGPGARASALSGGNQQKLVAGRELEGSHAAIVAENPSRGLDVQASATVVARLREARDAGMAVVVYSSDLDEVLEIADRVVVLYAGRLSEVPRDRDAVGRAMLGAGGP